MKSCLPSPAGWQSVTAVSSDDHPRRHGFIGPGIDENERAGDAIAAVGVMDERDGGAEGDAANVIHGETIHAFNLVKGVDVNMVFDTLDDCFGFLGCVADD